MPSRTRPEAELLTILVVDDEEDLLELLQYNLEKEGFRVLLAPNGLEGIDVARREKPDLIVLDIMMPGLDGIEVCRRLRSDALLRNTPILMLTARTEEEAQVQSLDIGADIYLPKPVSIPVLISQIKALVRTAHRTEKQPAFLSLDDLEIDRDRYLVFQKSNGETIEHRLPRKEFELLYFLASYPGKVFSRQDVLDKVWGHDVYVVDRTVDVHIRKIREKLGNDIIETVKGIGYKFKA
ncbi:MAG: response regulator transcription factor [Rhodothermales bacterium]